MSVEAMLTQIRRLTIIEHKKIKIIPPWEWHPYVGIDNSKKYKRSKEWFEEHGFLWEVRIDGEVISVPFDSVPQLLTQTKTVNVLQEI